MGEGGGAARMVVATIFVGLLLKTKYFKLDYLLLSVHSEMNPSMKIKSDIFHSYFESNDITT